MMKPRASSASGRLRWHMPALLLALLSLAVQAQTPTVVRASLDPRANARAAARNSLVSVPFTQPIRNSTTGNIKLFSPQFQGLRITPSGATGNTATLVPAAITGSADFKPGETLMVTVPTTVTSTAGQAASKYVYQFTAAAGVGPGTFSPGPAPGVNPDPGVGAGPASVAVGDVDGDGDLDLLTANRDVATVSVRLNDGTGGFSGSASYAVGDYTADIALADLDGDYDLDFVTANQYDNNVSIRLNNGNGVFSGGSDPSVTSNQPLSMPCSVAVGDVDGDGDLDLLTANADINTVSMLLNNGRGAFSLANPIAVGNAPTSVTVGDVDGDGDLDLLTANAGTTTVSIRLNNGNGVFSGGSNLTMGGSPGRVVLGDVDGDNDLDLLTANSNATVSIRLNDGSGGFSGGSDPTVNGSPADMALGDVDGDSDLDLVTVNGDPIGTASIRLNNGSGVFGGGSNPYVGNRLSSLALADGDGDGDLDLFAPSTFYSTVNVRFNQPDPVIAITSFTPTSGPAGTTLSITGTDLLRATAITFTGNTNNVVTSGYTVVSNTSITGIVVPGGALTGTLTVTTPRGTSPASSQVFDVMKIRVTALNPARNAQTAARTTTVGVTFSENINPTTAGNIKVFGQQYRGRRTATASTSGSTVTLTPTAASGSVAFRPGETVMVSVPATVTSTANVVTAPYVYQFTAAAGVGPGVFGGGSTLAAGINPYSTRDVAVGDLDGDGDLDLLTANSEENTVGVRLNNGSGVFGGSANYAVGRSPYSVAVGDVDGDGDLDFVSGNSGTATVSVRFNNGSGVFSGTQEVAVSAACLVLVLGDVDGDGDLDVLTANRQNRASVCLNNGSGVFSIFAYYGLSNPNAQIRDLAVGDVDGDGDLDLLTANDRNNTLSVGLNNGDGTFGGATEYALGINPYSLAVGDVDGDGDLDAVVANYTDNTVSVRLNNGLGIFTAPATTPELSVGTRPYGVVLGDVDGDGDFDLLCVNGGDNTVSVLLNNGSGGFGSIANCAVGTEPGAIAIGDVDGDGDLDLLTADVTSNTVSIRLNQTLPPTITSFTPTSGPAGTTVTVTGTYFTGTTAVTLNGVAITGYTVVNPNTITFAVPSGATSGPIAVTTPYGSVTSVDTYTVASASAPTIASFSPTSGPVGTSVTVTGTNLTGTTGLTLNGTAVTGYTIVNNTTITFTVPAGATSGQIAVTTPAGTATGPTFTVTYLISNSGNVTTCVGNVYDSGGPSNPYASNENYVRTFTPVTAGDKMRLTFTAFDVEQCCDALYIYDGPSTSSPLIGAYATNPGTVTASATNATGQLTLQFVSDYSIEGSGFAAAILCYTSTPPTIASFSPASGPVGTVVTVTGTNFTGTTAVTLNGVAVTGYTVVNRTTITFTVPSGATSGTISVTTPRGTATSSGTYTVTTGISNLTVTTTQAIPAGSYGILTVTGTGAGTVTGPITVTTALLVQTGGTLDTNGQAITGAGTFTLASGAILRIGDAAGLAPTGTNAGAVQVSGTRSYSPDASYEYNGTVAQATGAGLPAQVRNLRSTNPNPLTLTAPVAVAQELTLGNGNLALDGQPLTLLSSASGTALVINGGTGVVTGGTATVQRYLTTTNLGLGYRHYASPVSGTTLADLQTGTFTPVFNSAYNTSATPGQVTPFPTVYGYDQARLASVSSTYNPFDKGWFSPLLSDAMPAGTGYAVNLRGTELVDFTGTLRNGAYPLSLARTTGATAADAGWHLVGNPYPAPLDWSLVPPADRAGLDAAMYVFESSSQYGGSYRSYVNGIGSALIGSSQGFFVRVSQGQTSGSLTFRNSQRVTSFADQVPVRRGAADTRPLLQLTLSGAGGTDALSVYAEAGATAGLDAHYDALKLANPSGLNLAALTSAGEQLAIDGRPAFTSATSIPLFVGVPVTGTYTFTAATLANLSGARVELVDNLTTTRTVLTAGTSYAFTMAGYTAPGRFWLNLTPAAAPLATAAALAAQVLAYPNPAHGQLTVLRPLGTVSGATLLNSLGQTVRTLALPTTETTVDLRGLATGVYTLRLTLDGQPVTKRLAVD